MGRRRRKGWGKGRTRVLFQRVFDPHTPSRRGVEVGRPPMVQAFQGALDHCPHRLEAGSHRFVATNQQLQALLASLANSL